MEVITLGDRVSPIRNAILVGHMETVPLASRFHGLGQ